MPRNGAATREKLLDAAEQLVLERGFAATSVDAVLAETRATKGAFFHHFPSKHALGLALVQRYAAADAELLQELSAAAATASDDPLERLLTFARGFVEAAGELAYVQPGCMFAAFIRERGLVGPEIDAVVAHTIATWHEATLQLIEAAARVNPLPEDVDLDSLADMLFVAFEGGFVLARAMNEPAHLRRQLDHALRYLELLFSAPARAPLPARRAAPAAAG